ncbi:MAG: hypothetical protein US31_C0024G0001 [Berkelbacteria bacterium GW2011_GWA1_36_9]|uniref:Imm-5-like domain-containing protein n=1 Tax=Berkelbacteria bacterium GW2011_GWA1_36_9 TaxID=1618331 RepID=A0A0G0FGI3_9BACT|nr:MAG: hypothetical protein US31_C0024G0001 [Berkelbacteria bacterium GW2011_GWA1_36_9]
MNKSKFSIEDHRALVLWACDCPARVLPYFEKEYPEDARPRKAIEEARAWVREKLPMKMSVIRTASLDAHAAARSTDNPAARAAARAAGQAVATVHVPGHASAAADYAVKATLVAGVADEREWQYEHLPEHLRLVVFPS